VTTREYNRRIKHAIRELKASGAKRVEVELAPDGRVRVFEPADAARKGDATSSVLENRMRGAEHAL